jgi:TolB protein
MHKLIRIILAIAAFACAAAGQQAEKYFFQDLSWSPDGRYLAVTGMYAFQERSKDFKADIFVIRADGSGGMTRITAEDRRDFYTAWAGGRIAFGTDAAEGKDSDIYTARPDGTDVRQVTKGPGRNATPAFSRDGKWIAFVSTRDGGKHQIYIARADGSGLKRLTTDASVGYYNPQFSPDGRAIVYYAEKGDQKDQIWMMDADGSDQKLLTGGVGHNIFPGWSPDGRKIIFSSSNREKDDKGSYIDGSFLYTMNADGSGLAPLGQIKSFFARFSPDGRHIAYISGKFPQTAIYLANADGTGAVKIT